MLIEFDKDDHFDDSCVTDDHFTYLGNHKVGDDTEHVGLFNMFTMLLVHLL